MLVIYVLGFWIGVALVGSHFNLTFDTCFLGDSWDTIERPGLFHLLVDILAIGGGISCNGGRVNAASFSGSLFSNSVGLDGGLRICLVSSLVPTCSSITDSFGISLPSNYV
jgi:hypothetical protein